jgi:Zn-dependent protease with chaperone function
MKILALVILVFLGTGCLAKIDTPRRLRSWNFNDLARERDATQWLQDSSGFGFYISTKTVRDVLSIYARLQEGARQVLNVDAELLIVESDYANAFLARRHQKPYVCLTVPMVIVLGNDLDLYAALLAHEIGHLAWRHQQDFGRGLIFLNALGYELIPDDTPARMVAPLGLEAVGRAYSADQEREADSLGIELMMNVQLDATAAIRLHEVLKRHESIVSSFAATHPPSDERIGNIKQIIGSRKSNP